MRKFDTAAELRFYEYFELTGAFLDHHCSGHEHRVVPRAAAHGGASGPLNGRGTRHRGRLSQLVGR